jgi:hypothetical protein
VRSGKPAAAEAERTPGVGSIGPAEAEADATSTRGERRATGVRGGGDLQAPGVGSGGPATAEAEATYRRGISWRARRAEDKQRSCREMRKSFAGGEGRRRRRRRRHTGGLQWRRRWANPIARRGTRWERDNLSIFLSFSFFSIRHSVIPEWQYAVI